MKVNKRAAIIVGAVVTASILGMKRGRQIVRGVGDKLGVTNTASITDDTKEATPKDAARGQELLGKDMASAAYEATSNTKRD